MKAPPFLLLATLAFWGWLTDFFVAGLVMGAILESARFTRFRWELDDADFNRIWSFCVVLNVTLAIYVFTTSDEGGGVGSMFRGNAAVSAVNASASTAIRFFRWLPMTMFAFVAAQCFNERQSVPLTAVSLVLRWRRRHGDRAFTNHYHNISYPYFIACLFAAGIGVNNGAQWYFWGLCLLVAWALWVIRPARYRPAVWFAFVAVVMAVGFSEMFLINRAQSAIQNYNARWLALLFDPRTDPLQSQTSMGRIGELKLSARIAIWLQPREVGRVPTYLREASYRSYMPRRMTWYAGGNLSWNQGRLEGEASAALNNFELVQGESDDSTWILLPKKTNNLDAINIACYLNGWSRELQAPEGLLPLPGGTARLEKTPPAMIMKRNENGALLAAGRGLMIFDAIYGPGATIDAPPDVNGTNRFDLGIPTNEIPALAQVAAELNLATNLTHAQTLQVIEHFFLEKFSYSVWQRPERGARTNATPLTKFLLNNRSGHCEFFASATVLLLRQLNIPARYAVGYYVHETRGTGYVVRERDAHAWCLVWNEQTRCWEDFDTTPPSWVEVESKRTAFGQWFSDARSWVGLQFAKFRWRQAHLQQYIFWALVPVMLVLLYHIIFRRRGKLGPDRRDKNPAQKIVWPGLDSEFYQLEKRLSARGVSRHPGETLADWLERGLTQPALAELRAPLKQLLQLHYRHRFDPQGLSTAERESLGREAKNCLGALLRQPQKPSS
jgi:hypothetical protein